MYNFIKKNVVRFFPGLTRRYEPVFRNVLARIYKGDRVYCTVCDSNLRQFVVHSTGDLCPGCGSLGRHRRLWAILQDQVPLRRDEHILHFSPSKLIQKKLQQQFPYYISTDYDGGLNTDKTLDITNIDEHDNIYDVIICYHVLEHIIEDHQAISELYRVLKPGGKAIIQTPFKEGEIYEDPTITSREQRKLHFGQEDHVRIYSAGGLKQRLEAASFEVEILSFQEPQDNRFGFKTEEYILIARKPE